MQFIEVSQDVHFHNAVLGEGDLVNGKIYYTFGQFARETASRGLARIVDGGGWEIVHFKPCHLLMKGPRKILIFFSGGLGDAVTASIVLPQAGDRHGLSLDVCCAGNKWGQIFKPMGMKGQYVSYPPDLETLSGYEAVLTDLTEFYPSGDGLRTSPVVELMKGFHLDESLPEPQYEIPDEVRKRWRLEDSGRPRVGVNFDSHGLVKSYPEHLQGRLVEMFLNSGLGVFLLGSRNGNRDHFQATGAQDLRSRTTIVELAALIEQMDLVLGVDSFIVHLSNILSRPTLVLLSTTSPASFSWHRFVTGISSPLECSPCFALFDRCPKGYPGCRAFEDEHIAPGKILGTVLEHLAGAGFDKGTTAR